MKQSVGQTYLIYFISIFILIVFAFLCGIVNYMRAFKVNSAITNALENYEGLNQYSKTEIDNKLSSLGYRRGTSANAKKCNSYLHGGSFQNVEVNHDICISQIGGNREGDYFKYGVTTFIYLDLPWISEIKIPIYSESEKIYLFAKVIK